MRILTVIFLVAPAALSAQDFAPTAINPTPAGKSFSLIQDSSVSFSSSSDSGIQETAYSVLREQEAAAQAAVELAARIRDQGAAFSKEYALLNPFAEDFPENFFSLLNKYPLAVEDEFAAKLIERGHRMLRATRREAAQPIKEVVPDRKALEAEIQAYKENYTGEDLEMDATYIELRRRLKELSPSP
ncbi:MAG: hypothetical protein Fur0032_00130 [Terrimicrobiaceae bacterium]